MIANMKLSIDPRLANQIIEDKAYLVSPWDRNLHVLNEMGTEIWKLIKAGEDSGSIVEHISETYDCSRETAENDVIEFISNLNVRHGCRTV